MEVRSTCSYKGPGSFPSTHMVAHNPLQLHLPRLHWPFLGTALGTWCTYTHEDKAFAPKIKISKYVAFVLCVVGSVMIQQGHCYIQSFFGFLTPSRSSVTNMETTRLVYTPSFPLVPLLSTVPSPFMAGRTGPSALCKHTGGGETTSP